MIRYKKDPLHIVTLTLDMQGRDENIVNRDTGKVFEPVLKKLLDEKAEGSLRGVILTSAKNSFMVGGDLDFLYNATDAHQVFEFAEAMSYFFRALEAPGVPVVAAINGPALGSGFGMALACHHRIAINNSDVVIGLPEIKMGLMPLGGSVIRLLWLLGFERAYEVLITGRRYTPHQALEVGIIDALAENEVDMLDKAKDWLLSSPKTHRQWDERGGAIPAEQSYNTAVQNAVRKHTANLWRDGKNLFPAHLATLNSLAEGLKVDFDTACRIQNRYYTHLVLSQEAKSTIKAFGTSFNDVREGANRPKGFGRFRPRRVGIIGAGIMGSGISLACARAGLQVTLKDISKSVAEQGKAYAVHQLEQWLTDGHITAKEKEDITKRIITTENAADFATCDVVIETVFEHEGAKTKVLREAEIFLDDYAIIASNTSSIPISKMATYVQKPAQFLGMRFFKPVETEPLIELVQGENTTDETIARAFDFARAIRKFPIVVKDSWGFYAGRVQNTYILEGISLLQEGYAPALIENLGVQSGMPKGPLALADELGLTLVLEYESQAAAHYGTKYTTHPATEGLKKMIAYKRDGKNNIGFYDTEQGRRTVISSELATLFPTTKLHFDRAELIDRLLLAQVLEAVWCMQEGVVKTEPEADLGSIYGWGFPAATGGVMQFIRAYSKEKFLARCSAFKQHHGQRFKAPKRLKTFI